MRVEKYFAYEHLPPHLQAASKPVCMWVMALLAGDVSREQLENLYQQCALLPVNDEDEREAGLKHIEAAFAALARHEVNTTLRRDERAQLFMDRAVRRLLEAKDCFVRAAL